MIVLIDLIDLKLINRNKKLNVDDSIDKSLDGKLIASSIDSFYLLNYVNKYKFPKYKID